ncbi:hypothetical protein L2E82_18710 [Cichorium intybus]|uniref:Uncharacterized protein n=1 Tax=Cichorium intybus TaxID=13427 RepID=A0ACB9FAR7_CICIN|nr:hypothetical protein L2E82_18710 [Cichorium intybus]
MAALKIDPLRHQTSPPSTAGRQKTLAANRRLIAIIFVQSLAALSASFLAYSSCLPESRTTRIKVDFIPLDLPSSSLAISLPLVPEVSFPLAEDNEYAHS